MDTPNSTAMPIDHGPMAGWDMSITHIPHGIDAMDDLYVLDFWPPGADEAAHTFETYRLLSGTQEPEEPGVEELFTVPVWRHDDGDDACDVGGGTFSMNQCQPLDLVI